MQVIQSALGALQANTVVVGILLGLVTPALTAVVQQPRWSKTVRTVVAVVISAVVGLILAAASGQLDNPGGLLAVVSAVVVSAEAFYQKLWVPTGAASAIEDATSPTPSGLEFK